MRLPNNTQRQAIFGMTGTGKTQAGLWSLERRCNGRTPWIILDYKGDPMIRRIPGLEEIDIKDKPPKTRGLYVTRPRPEVDDEAVDDFLWKIWERGNTGVFLDEGYMIGRFNTSYRSILTQGRAKKIPVITLSQRPVWISPFILSESEYLQCFYLQTAVDVKRVKEFMPIKTLDKLPPYHSYWWDLKARKLTHLAPVPSEDEILDRFDMHGATHTFM